MPRRHRVAESFAEGLIASVARGLVLAAVAGSLVACGSTPRSSTTSIGAVANFAVVDGEEVAVPEIPMGDPATVRRILEEGINRNRVMDHLTHLAVEIGPRLTGSTRVDQANRWTADQFRAWGLGNVRLHQWGEVATRFDRGPSSGAVYLRSTNREGETTYDKVTDLDLTALAWTRGTEGAVRGPVVRMPATLDELAAIEGDLAGAWVLVPTDYSGRTGIRGVAGTMRLRAQQRQEAREAIASGASLEPAAPKYPRDGVSGRWLGTIAGDQIPGGQVPFFVDFGINPDGSVAGNAGVPDVFESAMQNASFDRASNALTFEWNSPNGAVVMTMPVADGKIEYAGGLGEQAVQIDLTREDPGDQGPTEEEIILRRILAAEPAGFLSSSRDERVWTTSASGWRERPLDEIPHDVEVLVSEPGYDAINSRLADGAPVYAEFDLQHSLTAGPIPVYNTVAEIPGTDPELADEVIIVSAHLDSWDGPGTMGTTDNGTGSSVVLESARLLMAAGARPKRTIRFILWTGEEQGLLGSRAYVEELGDDLAKVSAVFVDDGGTNYEGGLHAIAPMRDYLAAATAPVNGRFYDEVEGKWMNVNVRINDNMPRGGGSDHASFNARGVPGFFWDEVGRANYGRGWHTQFDRIDLAIPEYLRQSSTTMAITAYNLASAPEMLPRQPQQQADAANGG